MSKDRILWEMGDLVATGFLNPEADLIYLGRKNRPFGGIIVSVEDLAKIIVGHQTRKRCANRAERLEALI